MHRDFGVLQQTPSTDFSKLKIGGKTIPADVSINTDYVAKKASKKILEKEKIEKALIQGDVKTLRLVSKVYYEISGIYKRLCRYMASLFKYD